MTKRADDQELVLRRSPSKWGLMLIIGLLFVSQGAHLAHDHNTIGWLLIAFFGLCCAFALAELLWPSRLRIGQRSLALDHLWRHDTWEFERCSEFQVWGLPRFPNGSLVVFDYDGPTKRPSLVRINRALGARALSLPDTFGLSASALAQLLNERRSRSPSGGSNGKPTSS